MSAIRTSGFRLGINVFKDTEAIDFAAPYGAFSVTRRAEPFFTEVARRMEYDRAYALYAEL